MSGPGLSTNLPATDAGVAVVLERVAAQEQKIAAAGVALADAKLQLTDADAVFAEAKARYQIVEKAFNAARDVYWKDLDAHRRVQSAVTSAQTLLDAAVREMDVVRAPLHPVRRTPLEVLGHIFEFYVDHLDLFEKTPADFRRQPFILAGVCSHWRRAALLHTRIWAGIDIRLDTIKSKNVPTWRTYLSTMLARAGKAALSLRIKRSREAMNYDAPLVKILHPALQRCHSLHIDIYRLKKKDNILPLVQAELPVLRRLRVEVTTLTLECDTEEEDRMAEFFHHACFTAVTSLSLAGSDWAVQRRMALCKLAAQYMGSTLTTLHIELILDINLNRAFSGSMHLFFAGLSLCSELTCLKIDAAFRLQSELAELCEGLGTPSKDAGASGIWVCPKLRTLDIGGCSFARECDQGAIAVMLERRLEAANNDAVAAVLRPSRITRVVHSRSASSALDAAIRAIFSE
ncbi:hypothetical protein EXIGLDRAFT_837111 [Exidia glandulosa HHB12029]|uniref:F-box domain-containing protein n=1 Tax=Exidia glandulosa HHB12029 TaxID=1314781 RepID=A0A165H572_EXIGL|nr:hypothetical protein EXIGLDRAFT_837111 [Exidia glandulosa HHB12029]